MRIVGFEFTKMDAETTRESQEQVKDIQLQINPRIIEIKKKDVVFKEIKNVLEIEFEFNIRYGEIGHINFAGNVFYQTEKADTILKDWRKNKHIGPELTEELMNMVFRRCLTKAVDVSNELRLPAPITFPKLKIKPDENPYVD